MAITPVCKAVITTTLLASTALLASSCSNPDQLIGQTITTNAEAAAGATSTKDDVLPDDSSLQRQGVRTVHDVFHSRTIEVPAGTPVPAVTVRVEQDEIEGWNLYVGTANFTFEPTKVNGESSATAGHAHLYINDKPAQRIYGTWTHLPTLPGGENTIRVTLNANSFETLTTQGQPIEDSSVVEVYDPQAE